MSPATTSTQDDYYAQVVSSDTTQDAGDKKPLKLKIKKKVDIEE